MDMERAKEIFESPNFITVTYHGTPIHIDRLYESSPFVEVSYENGAVTSVSVEELREGGKVQ
jgi:H-type small acid-soluble spore protein